MGNTTTLAVDQSFAKLAAPLGGKPALLPDSRRAPLEKVLAIWVSRKRDLDSSIIQNLARHEFYKFIDVSAYSIVMGVWQMQEKV